MDKKEIKHASKDNILPWQIYGGSLKDGCKVRKYICLRSDLFIVSGQLIVPLGSVVGPVNYKCI